MARAYDLTGVGWIPTKELDLAEWSAIGRSLGNMVRASQWWLGDWIRYGNAKFGEKYSRAVNLTGYDAQTLMIMVHVATRFEIFRRRKDVHWSHHVELASLEPDEQDHWLEECAAKKLSVADLRSELRRLAAGPRRTHKSKAGTNGAVICPHCGKAIELADTLPSVVTDSPLQIISH
jgi:hypothetical protein